ncbi:hypothetical protein HY490_02835 [Candidatus Woesearchaeota archaeon]|nr:hypothetical protein [Candidatus Woesearchaeota archaeon]
MTDAYARAGVNQQLGDDASKVFYEAAKLTWDNRKARLGEIIVPFDDFSGLRVINVGKLPPDTVMCMGFDGVGTKIEIAERLGKHDTVAHDLFAMVCDDAVVRGGEPVLVGSILDVNCLTGHLDAVKQLATGYIEAARQARVAVINGEVAELGVRVHGYGNGVAYNWGAGVVWFARKDRLLTGHDIQPGQHIVAFREHGFRSNGLSLVRKVLNDTYGREWHHATTYASQVLHPSQIYSAAVTDMLGGVIGEPQACITGIAHITGGGIPGKLGRTLKPTRHGARLHTLFEPPQIMQMTQDLGRIDTKEAYRAWNMGNGMLVITPEPESVIAVATRHGIEAKIAGTVTVRPGITLNSYDGQILHLLA